MEFLYEFGLFLAKTITFVIAFAVIVGLARTTTKKASKKGSVEINNITEDYVNQISKSKDAMLSSEELKFKNKELKLQKKREKAEHKAELNAHPEVALQPKPRTFVIDFKGGTQANEVDNLKEEITVILSIANPQKDSVLLNIDSGGGTVVGYGLASSQIERLKAAGIKLLVSVDKVAASGGYMMACMADKLYAAPFSIVGSIGVVAEFPNFHKLLDKVGVNFEQFTAGEYKRTVSPFFENTDIAKAKFTEELEGTHTLFKDHISKYRPHLDMEKVATGEHWYAKQALEFGLIDELDNSDSIKYKLMNEGFDLISVEFKKKKKFSEKLAESSAEVLINKLSNYVVNSRYNH
jgi:serine protease SohB